ncbi:MAG: 16S rRNA (cytidine(1402)-2'-O)-methyltransferase [Bacteroidetes bacterium]|nr:16S rRNA (cytidine(1402)-2'-O)-methyltransferase [Bacteroidota bacterium]
MTAEPGTLYLVSTPIGNLEDMTFRAVSVLKSVSLIAAEDTRNSGILLSHYQIATAVISLHDHNERNRTASVLTRLQAGDSVALISDAGTPLISDPGYFLVREAIRNSIRVEAIPGASALLTALVSSGLACDQFYFVGFLPQKKGRRSRLQSLSTIQGTLVFYESPFRIHSLIEDCLEIYGNRQAVLTRELTKKFETIYRGDLQSLKTSLSGQSLKGEMVLLVEGLTRHLRQDDDHDQPDPLYSVPRP